MAITELPLNGNNKPPGHHLNVPDEEVSTTCVISQKQGGWTTFPFVTVTLMGLTIAASGWNTNLTVYLIERFNIKNIEAAQISNVVNGSSSFFPIVGAIIADSFLGNFFVVSASSFISLLGLLLLTLTASLQSLRPQLCNKALLETCETPSQFQFAILFSAMTLVALGMGGTRFTIAAMGADQFDKAKDQGTFFNWYFFTLYLALVIGITAIVYVEDNVGWGLGFGLCLGINAVGLAVFLLGKRYYRHIKPRGSPFTNLARVVVAAIRKKKVLSVSSESKDYYYGDISTENKLAVQGPTSSFRFLNCAALKNEAHDEPPTESWRLCTVQQVEDFKSLISIFPLWATGIFVSTPIGIQNALMVLQALSMDCHLGPHVNIPAGTFLVFTLLSTAISLSVMDRYLFPIWQKLARRPLRPLQRIGIGHVLNIVGMALSALVETRRLHKVRSHNLTHQPNSIVPMSAFWLVPPLAIIGVGEAFHFPGQVALYYQEFPVSLRSTATAMISVVIASGYYLSTALVDLIQRVIGWLPNNINEGIIDKVFWLLVVIGCTNFAYYITCAMFYKYKNVPNPGQKFETVNGSSS
ncbi:hypothetical protein IFM89_027830 [Coptis chinensis]|uniref:Uncharacterized protein n=1 Tax=Coptis chinensis TaxID=261450 RepID=A0A835HHH4_9MAGN|nr:hypothetical protein IFM89_027830 [Coptis chinensis]